MNELDTHAHDFKDLNKSNILQLVTELVLLAESTVQTGAERKKLVLRAVRVAISLLPASAMKLDLNHMIDNIVPDAIDLAISVSKLSVLPDVKKCFICC